MKLNRRLQLSILQELKEKYPASYPLQSLICYSEDQNFTGNIIYLLEHNLIDGERHYPRDKPHPTPQLYSAKITAHGLDFLEDDGGLRAILNKITIKIDSDDLQQIISARLDKEGVPKNQKQKILNTIKSLPDDGIKTVITRLINLGLDKTPDIFYQIQKILEQLI